MTRVPTAPMRYWPPCCVCPCSAAVTPAVSCVTGPPPGPDWNELTAGDTLCEYSGTSWKRTSYAPSRGDDLVVRDTAVRLRDREIGVALQRHRDRVAQREPDERLLLHADEIAVGQHVHGRAEPRRDVRHRRQHERHRRRGQPGALRHPPLGGGLGCGARLRRRIAAALIGCGCGRRSRLRTAVPLRLRAAAAMRLRAAPSGAEHGRGEDARAQRERERRRRIIALLDRDRGFDRHPDAQRLVLGQVPSARSAPAGAASPSRSCRSRSARAPG